MHDRFHPECMTALNRNGCPLCSGFCTSQYADEMRDDGMLYNWYAVENNNICPAGWRIPNNEDWKILLEYVEEHGSDKRGAEKLKSSKGWATIQHLGVSIKGTDEFGFSAKPAGRRHYKGSNYSFSMIWENAGNFGYWWSIDTTIIDEALLPIEELSLNDWANCFSMGCITDRRAILSEVHNWYISNEPKKDGYSIRCIKNK